MDAAYTSFPFVGSKRVKYSRLIVAMACILAPTFLWAQEADQKGGRSLRFVCVAVAPNTPEILWMTSTTGAGTKGSGKKLIEVELSTRSPGPPIKLAAMTTRVALGKKTDAPEKPIRPLVIVNVPKQIRRGIVLLVPTKAKTGPRYVAHVINEAKYDYGDMYFLNTTTKPFQVRLGDKKINLRKGTSHIFKSDKKKKAEINASTNS